MLAIVPDVPHAHAPAPLEEAARDLLAAARDANGEALRRAAASLAPEVRRMARAVASRQRRLAEKVGLTEDDLAQHIGLRLLTTPPTHEADRPLPAVLGWMRTVAVNALLSHADRSEVKLRHRERDDAEGESAIDRQSGGERAADERLGDRQEIARLRDCARRTLAQYKHLYSVFEALAEDVDVPAVELAMRLELVTLATAPDELRKGVQNAWQLRHRTLNKLGECMGMKRARAHAKEARS